MATIQEIITQARTDSIHIDPNSRLIKDAQLLRWANEAIANMEAHNDWEDSRKDGSITLINGMGTYDVPDDYKRIIPSSLKFTDVDGNIFPLLLIDLIDLESRYGDITKRGDVPQFVYESANKFGIFPVPNLTAITGDLNYSYYRTGEYGLGDEAPFPARWHYLITYYVAGRAYAQLPGRQDLAEYYNNKFLLGLRQLNRERLRRYGPEASWKSFKKYNKRPL